MKPGGTKGGEALFIFGLGLFLLGFGVYLFLDSVRVVAGHGGMISGMLRGRGMGGTLSSGLVFTPLFLGIAILFYDSAKKWAWTLTGFGLIFIIVEVISRTRFQMDLKASHMIMLLVMMAGGAALILRSYTQKKLEEKNAAKEEEKKPKN
ncbi:hypothetical protein OAB00_00135 [Akkermansiaceae bacterium]|nr:hypothetical protein [Akkermansiaceae bacterium]